MNFLKNLIPALLISGIVTGCLTSSEDEFIIPKLQQNTYLSHAKMPQRFGYTTYPAQQGVQFAGTTRLHPNHLSSADFRKGDLPVIKIRGRSAGNKMDVLLDLSSPVSWLEFNTALKFGTVFLGWNDQVFPYRGSLNTGNADAYAGVISQLRITNLFMENTPFYVRMASGSLGPLARGIRVPKIDAVLGYDNLRNFDFITLDLVNNRAQFSSTIPYAPQGTVLKGQAAIVKLRGHGLAVKGMVDGKETPILLDFAGNYHFARGDVQVTTTKQIKIGSLELNQAETMLLPIHDAPPRVGRKLLDSYIVTIYNKKGLVYFEQLPTGPNKSEIADPQFDGRRRKNP